MQWRVTESEAAARECIRKTIEYQKNTLGPDYTGKGYGKQILQLLL